jgi:hypothetical protein
MDCEDVAENRPASISMKHVCMFADRVFAKTLQTGHPADEQRQGARMLQSTAFGNKCGTSAEYFIKFGLYWTPYWSQILPSTSWT